MVLIIFRWSKFHTHGSHQNRDDESILWCQGISHNSLVFTFSIYALSFTQWPYWSLIVEPEPWDFLDTTSSPSYPSLKTLDLYLSSQLWFLAIMATILLILIL